MSKTAAAAARAREQRARESLVSIPSVNPAYIVNVAKERWVVQTALGMFVVPARKEDEEYGVLRVEFQRAPMDRGGAHVTFEHVNAIDIAKDLVRMIEADVDGEGMSRGVFVSETENPGAEELSRARERHERWLRYLVEFGDGEFSRYRNVAGIPDAAKRAVRELGEHKEWAFEARRQPKVPCTYCGEEVMPGVAICKHCGSILDREKWAKGQAGTSEGKAKAK